LLPLLGALACAPAMRSVSLPVQILTTPGTYTQARIEVPKDWTPLAPSSSRAEFLAPDRRSRVYFRAMPGDANPQRCAKLARDYASDSITMWGGPPATRVAHRRDVGDTVDFELRRRDPAPGGEVIWSRVVCRNNALAIASCTVPTPREAELREVCLHTLQTLQL
jgi:hypothetical protein